ncbi:hypothetical protein QJS04_geneDACA011134 [Acorus gramineus]|uniref:very-long-chain 3-oxoacyl-CoA synthase n=1 Tax=Acorus gramineus TaxID=55184 RepID=A0AAV9BIL9_ACOGR|nr:hypothetical protein QJS04_geneDACA011134 [Acorus gramineus]
MASVLHHYLVNHQTIQTFHWDSSTTFASSKPFIASAVLSYLTLTLLFHHHLLPLPRPSPSLLRLASASHNLLLLLLSLTMAVGCSLSALSQMPNPSWLLCFPPSTTPSSAGPVFFWVYVFYLSKLLEFVDTLFILLGRRKLTFLHVYHHASVVVMCYVWMSTRQSMVVVALVTNACVHTLMYGYYFMCSLGRRPWWKRAVTDVQILQFLFSFAVSGPFLWYHFTREGGCSGFNGWVFNAFFNASLLALFLDFHSLNYASKEKKG